MQLGQGRPLIIDALLKAFGDEEQTVRQVIVRALGEIKQATLTVIETLLKALGDKEHSIHQDIMQVLVQLGQEHPVVIDILFKTLGGNNEVIRQASAEILGQIKQMTHRVVHALFKTLRDQNFLALTGRLMQSGVAFGTAVEAEFELDDLFKILGTNHEAIYQTTVELLEHLGQIEQVNLIIINNLLGFLRNKNLFVRVAAVRGLGEMKQTTPPIINALLRTLNNKDWGVCRSAAQVLIQLGQECPPIIDMFLATLKNKYKNICKTAMEALGEIKQPTPVVTKALIQALGDVRQEVRQAAIQALGQFKPTPLIVDALLQTLEDKENDFICQAVVTILGQMKYVTLPFDMLFRFTPPITTFQTNTQDTTLLQQVLCYTQGRLKTLIRSEQPTFDLKPLRDLPRDMTLKRDEFTLTLACSDKKQQKQDDNDEITTLLQTVIAFTRYVLNPLSFSCQLHHTTLVFVSETTSVLTDIQSLLEALHVWVSLQPLAKKPSLKETSEETLKLLPSDEKKVPLPFKTLFKSSRSSRRPKAPLGFNLSIQELSQRSSKNKSSRVQTITLFTTTVPYHEVFRAIVIRYGIL